MDEYKILVQETGSSYKAGQWDQIVEQICLLYQSSVPKLLVDELRNEEVAGSTVRSGGSQGSSSSFE